MTMIRWEAFTDERARVAWDEALMRFPACSPFQCYAWGEYRRGLGWRTYRWAAFNEQDEIVAMLQAYVRRHRFGVGLLWSEGGPVGDLSACDESLRLAIKETVGLKRLYCRFRCDRARGVHDVLRLKVQGWCVPWAELNTSYTIVLDLTPGEDALLTSAARNWRGNLRRSKKSNLTTRHWLTATADEIHAAFESMQKAKGLDEQHSREEIEQLLDKVGDRLILYRCDDEHGELMSLAGALVFGREANLWLFATTEAGRNLSASYAVFWKLVQHCQKGGVTAYDLGGIDPVNNPGVYRFKKDTGATPVELLGEWDWATRPWLRWFGNWAIAQRRRIKRAESALNKADSATQGSDRAPITSKPVELLHG